jgi:hypothetical protein
MLLSAVAAGHAAVAGDATPPKCGAESVKADTVVANCSNVATAQKPATYQVRDDGAGAEALELTARPLAVDASSAYLVQVFVDDDPQSKGAAPKLLGSFSFFPARIGQAQTFVLPKPAFSGASSGKELTLSIKLVSANASRTLKDAAVEIMDAKLVK